MVFARSSRPRNRRLTTNTINQKLWSKNMTLETVFSRFLNTPRRKGATPSLRISTWPKEQRRYPVKGRGYHLGDRFLSAINSRTLGAVVGTTARDSNNGSSNSLLENEWHRQGVGQPKASEIACGIVANNANNGHAVASQRAHLYLRG